MVDVYKELKTEIPFEKFGDITYKDAKWNSILLGVQLPAVVAVLLLNTIVT